MFQAADAVDMREGCLAYDRYHQVMQDVCRRYGVNLERVTAVFCALSPNNDYDGNLRSMVSVLEGYTQGWTVDEVEVSTYRHCLVRAWSYMNGVPFLQDAKGLKIRNFYQNILHPRSNRFVTIDGHMVAIWRGQNLTMKEAICRTASEYHMIANATKHLAFENFMHPNQMQAVLWFVRKRIHNIKAGNAAQYDLLMPNDLDMWKTYRDPDAIKPFPRRDPTAVTRVTSAFLSSDAVGFESLWGGPCLRAEATP
jgi:hypothetical protein